MEKVLKFFSLEVYDLPLAIFACFLFFLFYKAMTAMLFKPFLEYLEERDSVTDGARILAGKNLLASQELDKEFDEKLFAARFEANKEREAKLRETEKAAQKILENASAEEQKISSEANRELAKQLTTARERIVSEVNIVSEDLARRAKQTLGIN